MTFQNLNMPPPSEKFSLWLQSPRKCAKNYSEHFLFMWIVLRIAFFAHLLGDRSKREPEKLENKPPLVCMHIKGNSENSSRHMTGHFLKNWL